MSGGPIAPYSRHPATVGKVFPRTHVGAGGNAAPHDVGMGVLDSLDADAVWDLRFLMPPSLPSGTAKLLLIGISNNASEVAKVNPKWASVAADEDPSAATLNAEGTSTVTWATGDEDVYKITKITLDADTVVAGEIIAMALTYETSGWTLSTKSTWLAFVIWE